MYINAFSTNPRRARVQICKLVKQTFGCVRISTILRIRISCTHAVNRISREVRDTGKRTRAGRLSYESPLPRPRRNPTEFHPFSFISISNRNHFTGQWTESPSPITCNCVISMDVSSRQTLNLFLHPRMVSTRLFQQARACPDTIGDTWRYTRTVKKVPTFNFE